MLVILGDLNQNSMGMGVIIEKLTWGSWTHTNLKLQFQDAHEIARKQLSKILGIIGVDSGLGNSYSLEMVV